jgi:hypothetical protein
MSAIVAKTAEQRVAEGEVENFRKGRGPFVVAAETTRMAMVFTDAKEPDNPIIFANDAFLAPEGMLRAWPVSKRVNSSRADENDATLIETVELNQSTAKVLR